VPRKDALARFLRGAYPMPATRRKDRPLHRFDYEQIQSLVWLGEPVDDFRAGAAEWTKPSYFTKTYELHENPVLQQETGAILSRKLLQLEPTEEWRAYIRSRRRPNGSFNMTPGGDGGDGHVTNTLWGLLALSALGVDLDRKTETADWIRRCQAKNGGFTYAPAPVLAAVDHVDYTWAALSALRLLDGRPRDEHAARAYLLSLGNDDGGFGDRPGRASNPLATWQALEALACRGPVGEIRAAPHHAVKRDAAIPAHLNVYTIQIEAPGVGSPREAAEMARALKIDLWGAKNCADGWISRAQQIAREDRIPVTFFPANEEYGTYVAIPGLGTYSHLADVNAPAGSDFGAPLSAKDQQPNPWPKFLADRIAPLRRAGGSNVWQFNENEELTRVLLNQAVAEGTFSAISSFHFGVEHFLHTQPFLNRYRDVMPYIGLQDAHTQTWWWMEYLVAFRTLFLAERPTWDGWREALRRNWVLAVRHDAATGFKHQVTGGSNALRKYIFDREERWRWWGAKPEELMRPAASLVAVTPAEQFEEAHPQSGVALRLRCWFDTQPFGVPKHQVVELVRLEVDGKEVKPELVQVEPKGGNRGDVYHVYNVPPDQKGRHNAIATVRNTKSGVVSTVNRSFTI
jgi:hypothetical protein